MNRVLVLILVGALTVYGQVANPSDYVVTVHVQLVALPVSVVDKHDQPVLGLQAEHFKVYEDKVLQNISVFKQEDVPVSVGLVLDSSGSMELKQERLITAAMRFAKESNPEDETFIVSFADFPSLDQEFTGNRNELEGSLRRVVTHGGTALYDAVAYAADHLKKGVNDKKVLLVVTDGEDNVSQSGLRDVLEQLKESSIIVYSIGLLSSNNFLSSDTIQTARHALKAFSEVTGGEAYFPRSLKDIDEICWRVAREVRSQYTIGYRPSNENLDGSWRTIKVQTFPPKGAPSLRVRTKRGYYAPSAPHASTEVTSRVRP
jgi:VWFA-related protein